MFKDSLSKTYARKFCEEHNSPNIKERLRELGRIVSDNGFETVLINGEYGNGPYQTWPAQLDDFSYIVSKDHAHRNLDYETLKDILLLEHPEIPKRNYVSQEEYQYTVKGMLEALMIGMKAGKLERIFERKVRGEEENTPRLLRPFFRRSAKKKVSILLKPMSDRLCEHSSDYWVVRNLSFNKRAA